MGKNKNIKYFKTLTKEECDEINIDFDELINNSEEYFQDNEYLKDLLPSMCSGRDYKPQCKEGETVYFLLGNRKFAFEVYTGECIESNWHHIISETEVKNFREIFN